MKSKILGIFSTRKEKECSLKPYSFLIEQNNKIVSVLEMETVKKMCELKTNNKAIIYKNGNVQISVIKSEGK